MCDLVSVSPMRVGKIFEKQWIVDRREHQDIDLVNTVASEVPRWAEFLPVSPLDAIFLPLTSLDGIFCRAFLFLCVCFQDFARR